MPTLGQNGVVWVDISGAQVLRVAADIGDQGRADVYTDRTQATRRESHYFNPGETKSIPANGLSSSVLLTCQRGTLEYEFSTATASTSSSTALVVTAKRQAEMYQYTNAGALIQAPSWTASKAYTAFQQVRLAGGQLIMCIQAGTSAASAPTFNSSASMSDGSVLWGFTGKYSKLAVGREVPVVTQNNNGVYGNVNLGSGSSDAVPAATFKKFTFPCSGYAVAVTTYSVVSTLYNNGSNLGFHGGDSVLVGMSVSNSYMEFITDDPAPGLQHNNSGVGMYVYVGDPDGQDMVLMEEGGIVMGPNSLATMIITWPNGRKLRRYRVELVNPAGNSAIEGYSVGAQSRLYATPIDALQGLFITDSFGNTSVPNGAPAQNVLGNNALRYAGVRYAQCAVNQGSGYASGYTAYGTSPQPVTIPLLFQNNAFTLPAQYAVPTGFNPTVVVFAPGFNDSSLLPATITAGALYSYQQARVLWPKALIVVFGPQVGSHGATNSGVLAAEAAVLSAFNTWADSNSAFYPVVNDPNGPWTDGAGYNGAGTGTGNADFYTGVDGAHPPIWGHDYLARRYAFYIDQAMTARGL